VNGLPYTNVNAGGNKDDIYGLSAAEKDANNPSNYWNPKSSDAKDYTCGQHPFKKNGEILNVQGCGMTFKRKLNKWHHYYACDGTQKLVNKANYKQRASVVKAPETQVKAVQDKSSAEKKWELDFLSKKILLDFKQLCRDSISMEWGPLTDKYGPLFTEEWMKGAFAFFCSTITVPMKKTTTVKVVDSSGLFATGGVETTTTVEEYDVSLADRVAEMGGQTGIIDGDWVPKSLKLKQPESDPQYHRTLDVHPPSVVPPRPLPRPRAMGMVVAQAVAAPVKDSDYADPSMNPLKNSYDITVSSNGENPTIYHRPLGSRESEDHPMVCDQVSRRPVAGVHRDLRWGGGRF